MTVVISGFIVKGSNKSLKDVNEDDGTVSKNIPFWNHGQRVFADDALGLFSMSRFSFVLFEGVNKLYWFAKVFLFFYIEMIGVKCGLNEFGFVKCFEIAPALDKIDKILDCICFRWAKNDETDHSYLLDSFSCN